MPQTIAQPRRLHRGLWLAASLAGALIGLLGSRSAGAQVPQGTPLPRILPARPPAVSGPAPSVLPQGPAAVPNISVAVKNVSVVGATVFPESRLQPLIAGLTGPSTRLSAIEKARVAILDLYRRHGYPLVTVSATLEPSGTLSFTVIEAYIAAVKLAGNIGPAGTQVLRFLNHLTAIRPISNAALERWLLLAQDVPGVSLRAVLKPSTGQPGALTLVAEVSRKPFSGLITADNAAFPETGPAEGLLVLNANSFTEFGEQTEVSLYHTSGSTQNFGQISYEQFVGSSGLRIRLYYGDGVSNPYGQLASIGYQGLTTVFGVGGVYPLIRSRQQNLNLIVNLDGIRSEVRDDSGPQGQQVQASLDEFRVLRLGFDYALEDTWLGAERPAIDTASMRISFGLPFLGGTGNDNADPSVIGEQVGFTKIAGELTRTQTLFSPWAGASVALKGLLTGQWSGVVLPAVEKFYLGGLVYNRGFYSGEVTGDKAVAASAELELNTGLSFDVFGHPFHPVAQFFGFYDWGYAWQNQPLEPNGRLASAGGGVRLSFTPATEVDLVGLTRFTRTPLGAGANVTPLKTDAVYWRMLVRF
ncbi:MAG: ShlB/FhaC/HecB family hemolysin secretion/activation protein [Acetobacteraceae bacterium]